MYVIRNGYLEAIAGRGIPDYGPLQVSVLLPTDEWVIVAGSRAIEAQTVTLYQGDRKPKRFPGLLRCCPSRVARELRLQ